MNMSKNDICDRCNIGVREDLKCEWCYTPEIQVYPGDHFKPPVARS